MTPIAIASSVQEAYFRATLLFEQVVEILHLAASGDDHPTPIGGDRNADDAVALETADVLLAVAHVERLLQASPMAEKRPGTTEAPGVLGVTPSQLRQTWGLEDERTARFLRESARVALLPRVEARLRTQCDLLCEIVLPMLRDRASAATATTDSGGSVLSSESAPVARQVIEVPALILELQSRVEQRERAHRVRREQLHAALVEDLERVKQMLHLVQQLLVEYKQRDQPRALRAKLDWLRACSEAMRTRTRVVTSQLLIETYPAENVELLRHVHGALVERRQRAMNERETLMTKLHLYRSADAEYQALVQEYSRVQRSIQEKKTWIQSLDMT
ncbi:hypothetical protein P43SY_008688 [Pythium insidiosum]|uniref:HAUS augmin-like complex subunit 4 n=1 Tax=Pythium insidiosum TaxID=114742 RepID=A0AAD5M967_PYTIN|nr:hypothetical protein P43SY_008688 [Pythium insidiosum]